MGERAVTGALGASAGGAGAGYAGNFLSTLIQTGDLRLANKAGLNGAKTGALMGFGVGAATGAYGGYKYAKANNLDPWSGKRIYPGHSPVEVPGGFEWRGKPGSTPGAQDGNWYNPNTGESLHPDLYHPDPIGPHWDYRDSSGKWWRLYPDGSRSPK